MGQGDNTESETRIEMWERFLGKAPGGFGMLSYQDSQYHVIYYNERYYEMTHTARPLVEGNDRDFFSNIHPDDIKQLRELLDAAATSLKPIDDNARIRQGSNYYRWFNLRFVVVEKLEHELLWCCAFTDIDNLIEAESNIEDSKKRYELAVKGAHLAVWEYVVPHKRLLIADDENSIFARKRYGFKSNIIENVPDCMLSMGVSDDDRKNFIDLFRKINEGQEYVTADVWFYNAEDGKPVCDRISYFVVKDSQEKPIHAYGMASDITAEKQEQLRFHQSIQSILSANPNALCTFQLNLSKNTCYEGHGASPFILRTLQSDTVDGLFINCKKLIPDEKELDHFYAIFDRQQLISEYKFGKKNLHVDYRRSDEHGNLLWVRTYVSLLDNPATGDIEGVVYSLDISEEIQQREIFNILTGKEYDLVAVVHLDTKMAELIQTSSAMKTEYQKIIFQQGAKCTIDEMKLNGANTWVAPEEREKYLEGTKLSKICKELDANGYYELTIRGHAPNGDEIYRSIEHYYLDERKSSILIIDMNVTAAYQQQKKNLELAKSEAEHVRDILDHLSCGVAVLVMPDETHLRIEYANKQMRQMANMTDADISFDAQSGIDYYKDAFSGIHPEDVEHVKECFKNGYSEDKFSVPDFRLRTIDGKYIWVAADVSLRETSESGKVFYGAYRDTSKEVELQAEIDFQHKRQVEQAVVGTIGNLPSASALFRVYDDNQMLPVSYSDEFCKLGGYSQTDDLFRDDAYGGVHPEDAARVMAYLKEHMDDPEPFNIVYRIITKAKTYIWVSVNFNTFKTGDKRYLYAVYTDISDLKHREQLLEEQYKTSQMLLDSYSKDYLATTRVNLTTNKVEELKGNGNVVEEANARYAFGQAYEVVIQQFLDHISDDHEKEEMTKFLSRSSLLNAYRNDRRKFFKECLYESIDGDFLWVRCDITLSKRPGSDDVILFLSVSDVNEVKLVHTIMDDLVTRQYDYLSCIGLKTHKILLFFSKNEVFGDGSFFRGMNYTSAMHQYNEQYVIPSEKEDCIKFMDINNVAEVLKTQKRYFSTFTVNEGQGLRIKQVEFFYIDELHGLIALVRTDITETQKRQKMQEAALRDALDSAKKANKAKSEFLSRISHDMRTPLNGIIGMTYLAQERNTQPETREYLNKIDTSSKFLIGLINDVLDMSKAESDDITLKPEPYTRKEFYEYLEAVIRPLCTSKHQEFFFDSDFNGKYVLLLDKLRFNQVVFNLLSNASKYTPQGGKITYQSYFSDVKSDGTIDCTLTFSDNGIGMSTEFQKVLFEPFSRETRKETAMIQGTGLGLPIVYKVVKLMNGTIDVDSKIGKGTTFTVHLNLPVMSAAELDTMKTAKESSTDLTLLKGKHILVCEDHPINQEIAKTLLEEKEAIVTIAENGRLGVEKFKDSSAGFYDLILMDIRMPLMTGFEAAKAIRKLDRSDAREIPIIAMTADAFVDDVQACYKAGMNHHITKPIEPEMLYKTLLQFLSEKQFS